MLDVNITVNALSGLLNKSILLPHHLLRVVIIKERNLYSSFLNILNIWGQSIKTFSTYKLTWMLELDNWL